MAVAFTFDLLQNQNYQIFFVFKRVSVMLIKKSRQGYIFLKKKSFLKARLKHTDIAQERYKVNVHEE